jgi:glycosyltransferase involved in cell wall biosynthesis
MNKDRYEPLVSVAVITFNSERFILDTLESVKRQTYKNIELVISDDCSTDKTVDICSKWLSENIYDFKRTVIIRSEINTGISANINRAIQASNGIWIKTIAGDDLLFEDCISKNLAYVEMDNEIKILFSRLVGFKGNQGFGIVKDIFNYRFDYFNYSPQKQYEQLLIDNFAPAPTLFIKREIIIELKGFDEDIPFLEDYPFWIKACRNNYKLHFMNRDTVYYRIHDDNLSKSSSKSFINKRYLQGEMLLYNKYFIDSPSCLLRLYKFDRYLSLLIKQLVVCTGNTKYLFKTFYYIRILSPIMWLNMGRKIVRVATRHFK